MNNFDFKEALSFMECGLAVQGPGGRVYLMENNQIICYPKPVERPRQKRVEVKFSVESILSKEWHLYECVN